MMLHDPSRPAYPHADLSTEPKAASATIDAPSTSHAGAEASEALWSQRMVDPPTPGEIVIFAVKPSIWRPCCDNLLWLAFAVIAVIAVTSVGAALPGLSTVATCQLLTVAGLFPLVVGFGRWVSTWYVLTSRRIITIRGIRRPVVTQLFLTDVDDVSVTRTGSETIGRWATIIMLPVYPEEHPMTWRTVSNAEDLARKIRQAVRNARQHHC